MGATVGRKVRRAEPAAGVATIAKAPRRVLRLLGPGLVTGASDNDPSGIATFTQIGSQFAYGGLWLAVITTPLMIAVQEMCARIGLQTGRGLGRSLRRKYPDWLVGVAIAALFGANTLTLGADLSAIGAAAQLLLGKVVPLQALVVFAGAAILGLQLFGSYNLISSVFKWLTVALFAYIAAAFMTHVHWLTALTQTFAPHVVVSPAYIAAVVAGFGTTISPYLFFWQASSEVDRLRDRRMLQRAWRFGATDRQLREMRIDVVVGMVFSQVVAYFIVLAAAGALHHPNGAGIATAAQAAAALKPAAGPFASLVFAVGIIATGFLAVPILSGSAAYALKEFRHWRGDMEARPGVAPYFYGVIVLATALGVGMNFLHFDTVRALYLTSMLNGIVAPLLLVMIVLLGRDKEIMGKAASSRLSVAVTGVATVLMSAAAAALLLTQFVR